MAVVATLAIGMALPALLVHARQRTPTEARTMKIRLKVGDKVLTATLRDNETSRDFVSLLPLTLTMNDLFKREKFAHLPRAISQGGGRTHTYEVGDFVYWPPGPDVAIFYRHDGQFIDSGIITMGALDSGVDALNVPGSVKVTVELAK
ncbi:cyclophilin-like fold protein [Pyxidicoccus parkwayensis]|uniref:cyclophilin-like fold protein n=1 Tax=Pyxidicoccus parkwayensis TaxID=2813578 RepID=UPI001F50A845|nr:cyclophilin-like fold protein [Pyxidicoccus parkwaysis]